MNRTSTLSAGLFALLIGGGVHANEFVIADSNAEFSGVQGQDGWVYGFYPPADDADGQYSVGDFVPLEATDFVGSMWTRAGDGSGVQLRSFGGAPSGTNRSVVEWSIRRWESEQRGNVRIEGTFAGIDRRNNGVAGRILVDGVEIWSETVFGNASVPYSVETILPRNANVDFVLDAVSTDNFDVARFTAVVTKIPCPGEMNGDGVLDLTDLLQFLVAWFEGDADFNGDGTTDLFDFLDYRDVWVQNAYVKGCR